LIVFASATHFQCKASLGALRLLFCFFEMDDKNQSSSLKIGDRAPDFSLAAANREGNFSLAAILQRGPAIVEFLRGTW
jgi:hypothetical protein